METAEILGAAALLGIIVTAALAGYLISLAGRLIREVRELREFTSTADQVVVRDLREELGVMTREILDAQGSSADELKEELGKLTSSADAAQADLAKALKEHVRELRDLATALHQSTVKGLSEHEASIVSVMRELHGQQTAEAKATPATKPPPTKAVPPSAAVAPAKPPAVRTERPPASTVEDGDAPAPPPEVPAAAAPAAEPEDAGAVSPDDGKQPQAPEGGDVASAVRPSRWEELPEDVRARWMPQIKELILPPVSYDARHEDIPPRELVDKIKHDLVLCAKILAVANSAAQGQVKPVTSIDRAAIQLGTNMLQIIISAYHLEAIFGRYPGYSMDHFKFVQRWSCGSSVLAYHVALQAGSADNAMLSTAALIAKLGSLLLGMADLGPDEKYRLIPFETDRFAFELEHWGVCTPLLSEQVARHWGIPEPLPTLLRLQEQPLVEELGDSEEERNLVIICLSSVLVSAYIARGGAELLAVLNDVRYLKLKRNIETLGLQPAIAQAWENKKLQREFLSIMDMNE
jgi:HD-like signal output (HDOD) protein